MSSDDHQSVGYDIIGGLLQLCSPTRQKLLLTDALPIENIVVIFLLCVEI